MRIKKHFAILFSVIYLSFQPSIVLCNDISVAISKTAEVAFVENDNISIERWIDKEIDNDINNTKWDFIANKIFSKTYLDNINYNNDAKSWYDILYMINGTTERIDMLNNQVTEIVKLKLAYKKCFIDKSAGLLKLDNIVDLKYKINECGNIAILDQIYNNIGNIVLSSIKSRKRKELDDTVDELWIKYYNTIAKSCLKNTRYNDIVFINGSPPIGNVYRGELRSLFVFADERIFKIYVKNGSFGKLNGNKPIILPIGYRFKESTGDREFELLNKTILPPYKNEVYISAKLIKGDKTIIIPAHTKFDVAVNKISGNNIAISPNIKITNIKPILFENTVKETDISYKYRISKCIDEIMHGNLNNAFVVKDEMTNIIHDKLNGVFVDKRTGLMWAGCNHIPTDRVNLQNAKKMLIAFKLANHNDWRLPTEKEILTVGSKHCYSGHNLYWTSSKDENSNPIAYYLSYLYDYTGTIESNSEYPYIWPVRTTN